MIIEIRNSTCEKLSNELLELVKEYEEFCKLNFKFDLNTDNEEYNFPVLILAKDKSDSVLGFINTYMIDNDSVEFYCYVSPQCIENDIFEQLFDEFITLCRSSYIKTVSTPVLPEDKASASVFHTLGFKKDSSEYLLKFNKNCINQLSDYDSSNIFIECETDNTGIPIQYDIFSDDEEESVGICPIYVIGSSATIYSFEIFPEYRGNHIGTKALNLIIKDLTSKNLSDINLHVTSENSTALKLYTNMYFETVKVIDYWNFYL